MSWVKGTSQTNGTFNVTTGATEPVTLGSVAAGSVIAVALSIATDVGGAPVSGVVTDNLGNTYTSVVNVLDSTQHQRIQLFRCVVTNAGTPTLTPGFNPTPGTTTANAVTINADPFTGSDAASAGDGATGQNQASPGAGVDAVTSGAIVTATNGDLIYAATVDTTTGADPGTIGTGFTSGSVSSAATTIVTRTEFLEQGAAGSVAGTFTAGTGTHRFITAVMGVTPASAAPTAVSGQLGKSIFVMP